MEKNNIALKVAGLPLFADIPSDKIDEVMKELHGSIRHYAKSDYLYLNGDSVEGISMLISGSIQMVTEDFWGDKSIIDGLQPGYVFTEKYLGNGGADSDVSYVAVSDSEILYFPMTKADIKDELSQSAFGRMVFNLLSLMADHNARLVRKNEILSKKTLRGKILAYLCHQARDNNSNQFVLPFNRTDLAYFLDSDRCALARELTKMKKEGLIDINKNTFTLLKKDFE